MLGCVRNTYGEATPHSLHLASRHWFKYEHEMGKLISNVCVLHNYQLSKNNNLHNRMMEV